MEIGLTDVAGTSAFWKYLWQESAYSVEKLRFQRRQKNCRPLEASLHSGRGGRRDFVMRATKNLLTDVPAIHTAN